MSLRVSSSLLPTAVAPWAALIALSVIVVGVLDAMSTNAGLLAGAVEVNPLMAMAQSSLGEWWVVPKIGLSLITAMIVVLRPARTVFACVAIVVAFNAVIVLNNFALAGLI
ncbi:MAG: hypothetical protein GKS00_25135 [Alphaproteobacteria bacterium]|nr:hypothetical protein [Alphaproteobacteria bacterium]